MEKKPRAKKAAKVVKCWMVVDPGGAFVIWTCERTEKLAWEAFDCCDEDQRKILVSYGYTVARVTVRKDG